jgi:hypothetical protein
MKKFLLALMICFSLIGCSISEQIIFNEDGSGKLNYTIDMSKMITMTKDLDKSDKMAKELNEKTEKDMDSIISFKDIAALYSEKGKELTKTQLDNYEQMKNYSMRIVVNKAKSEMKYVLSTDFTSISEVGNVGSALSAVKDFSGKNTAALDSATPNGNSEVKYVFDGKSFSRTVVEKPFVEEEIVEADTLQWEEDFQSVEMTDAISVDTLVGESFNEEEVMDSKATDEIITDEDVENSELEKVEEVDMKKMNKQFKKMGKMMKKGMEDSTFEFQYTFTKKIKKVSLPKSSYKLSKDNKTIFLKYKFEEFSKKIKDLNLILEFE